MFFIKVFIISTAIINFTAYCYEQCDNIDTSLIPKSISVSNCVDKEDETCTLKRGKDVEITINFESDKAIQCVDTEIKGILILGLPVPFNGIERGCTDKYLKCTGTSCEYKAKLHVEKQFPPVGVTVQWALLDDNNKYLICTRIRSRIK